MSAKNSSLDSEISSKYEARIKNSKDRELSLEGLLADKEEILKDLRERNESLTQKLVGQQDGEATLGGNSENEREWNIEEIIKLKNRNLDLEVQIHGFKERLEGSLDSKLLEKERESWRVKEEEFKIEKQGLEDLVEEKQKSWEEEKSKLEEELKKEKKVGKEGESERKRLKTLLEERKDWEEVKRENLVMRMVEFNIEDEDEKLEEKEKMEKEVKPLEVLLIEKNRKLEKEVTDLRVSFLFFFPEALHWITSPYVSIQDLNSSKVYFLIRNLCPLLLPQNHRSQIQLIKPQTFQLPQNSKA